jgi:hypothetical protein
MKHDATRGREKTNERKTKRRRERTYPIRAASHHGVVVVPIYVKQVSAVRTPRFPFTPQTAGKQEWSVKIDRGDCDERTRRAM